MASSATLDVERNDNARDYLLVTNAELKDLRALLEEVIGHWRSVKHRPDPSWS